MVFSPFDVFSYATLGELSALLLRGREGPESGPLVFYKSFTRRCCCKLYTRHLWYTRLLNVLINALTVCTAVALSVAAASPYVLLLGVYI